ncbi:MAG TPA: hypothetical protein VFV89_08030 [Nocardioides sp.]|uniref:hypothetical protein n=1 Tax=Nocardioides sp. TaxID=35761 RepID=UPI002E306221|nr:hypothetical protein [Nocardioides sp.]HEX5087741.1 hypothetical protein [Nocardioides sp.]
MTERARAGIAGVRTRTGDDVLLLITRRPRSDALTVAVVQRPGPHDLPVDGEDRALYCGPVVAERLVGRALDVRMSPKGRPEFVVVEMTTDQNVGSLPIAKDPGGP